MKRISTAVLLALAAASCVATDVGNPDDGDFRTTLDFAAYEGSSASALTLSNGVEIDRALFGFDRFELRTTSDCEDENEVEERGVVVSELLSGEDYPELPSFVRNVSSFCRLELRIAKVEADEAPSGIPNEITDRSIRLEGSLPDGTPFELETTDEAELRLDPTTGDSFELEGTDARLFLAFDMNTWFVGIDLDTLQADADGVVRIGPGTPAGERFLQNVSDSARLFPDGDGNGVLDADETDDSLAVGVSR